MMERAEGELLLARRLLPDDPWIELLYAEFLEEGREKEAGRFAGAALGILMAVAGTLVLLGILVAPWLVAHG